jgi:hypothetical protein
MSNRCTDKPRFRCGVESQPREARLRPARMVSAAVSKQADETVCPGASPHELPRDAKQRTDRYGDQTVDQAVQEKDVDWATPARRASRTQSSRCPICRRGTFDRVVNRGDCRPNECKAQAVSAALFTLPRARVKSVSQTITEEVDGQDVNDDGQGGHHH